ncbi:MAG: gliding motility-associated-like protein, partial [Flavobacteriales bacterium]
FSGVNPREHAYEEPGEYMVTISVKDFEFGCKDTLEKEMILLEAPIVSATDVLGCDDGIPLQLLIEGDTTSSYLWTPATGLDDPTGQNPMATIFSTVNYNVLVTDVSGCVAKTELEAKILETPFLNEGLDCNVFGDTSLYIGEEISLDLNVFEDSYVYTWTPTDYLSCSDCYNPVISPLESIIYTVRMRDTSVLECFDFENIICIEVLKKSSVDVPTAFSPNGDGVNDIVYVDGWGIKELVSFRIYNRWGEVVFETTDKKAGWDGTYNGKLQEQDVYIYQVVAKFHAKEETESKQGNITLFR